LGLKENKFPSGRGSVGNCMWAQARPHRTFNCVPIFWNSEISRGISVEIHELTTYPHDEWSITYDWLWYVTSHERVTDDDMWHDMWLTMICDISRTRYVTSSDECDYAMRNVTTASWPYRHDSVICVPYGWLWMHHDYIAYIYDYNVRVWQTHHDCIVIRHTCTQMMYVYTHHISRSPSPLLSLSPSRHDYIVTRHTHDRVMAYMWPYIARIHESCHTWKSNVT